MTTNLRGKSAVIGLAHAGSGKTPGWDGMEILAAAASAAIEDAGLELSDIDGLCTGSFKYFFPTQSVAEYLGIRPQWSDSDMIGGPSFMNHLIHATAAVEAGLCNNVLICYGSNSRSARDLNGLIETPEFEAPYRPIVPMTGYALAASRYMHEYGITHKDMAEVAVAARKWAQLNPDAFARAPLSIDEVMESPFVNHPLRAADCCLMTDGGAAMVVTRADNVKNNGDKRAVYFLGGATAIWHRAISEMQDLTITPAADSGPRALEMAGVTLDQLDTVQFYDAFTLNTLLFLEDLGFCEKGAAGEFVADGGLAPGGRLALNTNGGGLSCTHPGMYGMFCMHEAITQLRQEAGERQVENAWMALCHGNGGSLAAQSTIIFGTEETL
jgi:acetyl-CoA acetyltransferase